jgi:hypothetical protein
MGTLAGLDFPEGDAGGLVAAARRLRALSSTVAGGSRRIARAGRVSDWEGTRYLIFAAIAGETARSLDTSALALERASRAVDDLAELIQRAQRRIRGWADEIESAEQTARTAESELLRALLPAAPLFAAPKGDFPNPSLVQAANQAKDRVAELRARYAPQARQLCDEVSDADRRSAATVDAALAAAPAGASGLPGPPQMPADVRLFAPVFLFAPGESYLPADPRRNRPNFWQLGTRDGQRYFRGQGAGAPIFYRVRRYGEREVVIEYWFYRRFNHFRDLPLDPTKHFDDSEAVAVRLVDGRPVQVGYSQHEHGCSLPFARVPKVDGHPVSYPGDGSAANSPYRGHDDRVPGPWDDLHGPAPGERTPPRNIVSAADNLQPYTGSGDWRIHDRDGNRVPDSGPNSRKFTPGSPVWSDTCEKLPPRE